MNKVTEVVDSYIAAWNERDSSRRLELLAKTWIENGSYIDPHRGGTGYQQLSAMIQTVHDAFPPAYRFRLASRVDEYGDRVCFQWEAPRMHRCISWARTSPFCPEMADSSR